MWWHWLDGNITQEGIRLDLEWMKRAGIGGVQIFDGSITKTTIVPKPLTYMSPAWRDAFRYAADLAKRQGMEVAIPTSAGWSETGASFVQPSDAMKKLVWSETVVRGGRSIAITLPPPPDISGPYQDASTAAELGAEGAIHRGPTLYRDTRVVAYRLPVDDIALPVPRVTGMTGMPLGARLDDGRMTEKAQLPLPTAAAPSWLRLDYPSPVTIRSAGIALAPTNNLWQNPTYRVTIEASADGHTFRPGATFAMGNFLKRTATFPAITGRSFRVVIAAPVPPPPPWDAPTPGAAAFDLFANNAKTLPLSQLALHSATRVERAEEKAGFSGLDDYYAAATPTASGSAAAIENVVDLTAQMTANGRLVWTPPPGRWRILRFGWSLTGKTNGPASTEGAGLEVDKLNASRVAAYMTSYLAQFDRALDGGPRLDAMLSDSIEAGFANWTDDLLEQFEARRGYDPAPYLPVLAGYIVGDAAASDRFLYDYRRTLADLIAGAHYGEVAKAARARGMTSYGESLESARVAIGDDLEMRAHADIPTGAMWQFAGDQPRASAIADLRGAASVAHLSGKPLVAAESMTAAFRPWAAAPRDLKRTVDAEFAQGANRILYHSSVHQPLLGKVPGQTLFIFGQYFNRNETWAEQARPWIDYIARTSHLLQQGRFAADVAIFYGEEAPLVALYKERLNPDVPIRYGYDYIDRDTLLSHTEVKDGVILTAGGARYRVLQLGGSSVRMTVPVLRKLQKFVAAGAVVVGAKPTSSPSQSDDPAEFTRLADALWDGSGAGRILSQRPVEPVLANIGVAPDHEILGGSQDSLNFVHRVLVDGDLWFVANPVANAVSREIAFRVTGRIPELYDAISGSIIPLDYRIKDRHTIVRLDLPPTGSALVVFRRISSARERVTPSSGPSIVTSLRDGWSIAFQPGRGAPPGWRSIALGSLSEHEDASVRYFSGTATYRRDFAMPRLNSGRRLMLDLGDVREIAEVTLNGRKLATLWTPPYRLDLTPALRRGRNRLIVKVTNLWRNRLIGDQQPGAVKITTTYFPSYSADAPLSSSGLIGPAALSEENIVR